MRLSMRRFTAVFLSLLFGWSVVPVHAHEGHDHGAPPPVSRTIAPRADAASGDFELVAIARGDRLEIYLDGFRDNAPIGGARLEIDSPDSLIAPKEEKPGYYAASAPFLGKSGRHDLAITVIAGDKVDILTATLVIPEASAARDASTTASISTRQPLTSGFVTGDKSLLLAAGIGFVAGALAVLLFGRRRPTSATALLVTLGIAGVLGATTPGNAQPEDAAPVAARDLAQRFADGALFVPKATQRILALRTQFTESQEHFTAIELPGRVIPDPNASGMVQSSVGGRLSPPEGGFKPLGTPVKAGDVLAFVQPPLPAADVTTQQQQARELDQQISIIARKVERLRSIREVIAQSQLEDSELELKGLRERRANLDRAPREAEALKAPVGGVIAASNAVAGQMAEPNSVIFHIVDPSRLWVEALSFDPGAIQPEASIRLADGREMRLKFAGAGINASNLAAPVHFAIAGEAGGLHAGQFVTVLARKAEARSGIAVPRASVLRAGNGQSIVYEHTNAERFVPREVRTAPLDGTRELVLSGLESGKRVVTEGAELLNQIR
jgi:membrane fusion protein, heavy metal efflux system